MLQFPDPNPIPFTLPTQAGNNGKYLTTNGTAVSWGNVSGVLPSQGGNAGKFLTTDGANATWDVAFSAATGLASGSGATVTVEEALAADVLAGTSKTKVMTPGDTYEALDEVVLAYAATVTPDMSTFVNAVLTLTGNVTLANPTNPKPGQSGRIRTIQGGGGSNLLSAVGSFWKRSGGLPTLTTTVGHFDVIVYDVITTTLIVYSLITDPT